MGLRLIFSLSAGVRSEEENDLLRWLLCFSDFSREKNVISLEKNFLFEVDELKLAKRLRSPKGA